MGSPPLSGSPSRQIQQTTPGDDAGGERSSTPAARGEGNAPSPASGGAAAQEAAPGEGEGGAPSLVPGEAAVVDGAALPPFRLCLFLDFLDFFPMVDCVR